MLLFFPSSLHSTDYNRQLPSTVHWPIFPLRPTFLVPASDSSWTSLPPCCFEHNTANSKIQFDITIKMRGTALHHRRYTCANHFLTDLSRTLQPSAPSAHNSCMNSRSSLSCTNLAFFNDHTHLTFQETPVVSAKGHNTNPPFHFTVHTPTTVHVKALFPHFLSTYVQLLCPLLHYKPTAIQQNNGYSLPPSVCFMQTSPLITHVLPCFNHGRVFSLQN